MHTNQQKILEMHPSIRIFFANEVSFPIKSVLINDR